MKADYIGKYTEDELINKCIIGDRSAQRALYNHYAPKMFAICLRYAKDYHTAEDILQDAFVKVFRNIAKFRREGSFEGWLRRIFVNTSIEYYRRQVHLYPIVDSEDKPIDIEDEAAFDHLDEQDLLNMVNSLSPGYKTVFNLYCIEGYSHKEIGKLLGVSEGTSKSQLARAKSILRDMVIASQKLPMEGAS